jgi:hypothetical protein
MFVNKSHVNKLKSNVLHKSVNKDCVIVYFLMKFLDVELKQFLWLYKNNIPNFHM